MNEKTLTALKSSIKKWEKIVDGTGVDKGELNCSLCKLVSNCSDCLIGKNFNMNQCRETPYIEWKYHHDENHDSENDLIVNYFYKTKCSKCTEIATEELNFLKSLLPENKIKQILK